MNHPTCLLAYYPEIPDLEKDKIKVTCFDKKIHIRLKNYNRPTKIVGFENKLNYLLCYLLHFQCLANNQFDQSNMNATTVLQDFAKTSDVVEILNVIQQCLLEHDVLGIAIKENKQVAAPFGNISPYYFPLSFDNDGVIDKKVICNLAAFLNKFRISIYDYLFNDKYIIILTNNMTKNINKKFINKQLKHKQKLENVELNVVSLW